jgi:hypothetical protein
MAALQTHWQEQAEIVPLPKSAKTLEKSEQILVFSYFYQFSFIVNSLKNNSQN